MQPVGGITHYVQVIRVSKQGKRADDRFKSPGEQQDRIAQGLPGWLPDERVELAGTFKEIDVSGYRVPLDKRKKLLQAIEMIESGAAQVLVVAYFNRLCRKVEVRREVVERVERAGGRVLAVDFGLVTDKTAVQWLTGTLMMAMEEYYSRQLGERLGITQSNSIDAGVPIGTIPPGYRKDPITRRLVVVEDEATVMREAFAMRVEGKSWRTIQRHMAAGGIVRSTGSVRKLLHSRTYLGELFFGTLSNPGSHQPIIDQATFDQVARQKGETFPKAVPGRESPLLLAGLRLLKCGTCGKSLGAAAQVHGGKSTRFYRCNMNLVCSKRTSIDARIADTFVTSYVRELLASESATEGAGREFMHARAAADTAQADYSRAQRNLALSADETETRQILADLKAARDAANDHAAELERRARILGDSVTLNAAIDWSQLTLSEQRDIIGAVLDRVDVTPGGVLDGRRLPRGASRLHPVERGETLS